MGGDIVSASIMDKDIVMTFLPSLPDISCLSVRSYPFGFSLTIPLCYLGSIRVSLSPIYPLHSIPLLFCPSSFHSETTNKYQDEKEEEEIDIYSHWSMYFILCILLSACVDVAVLGGFSNGFHVVQDPH